MEGAVAKLILDSLDNNSQRGTLGYIFQTFINTMKSDDSLKDEKEIELARKLKYLKECEKNSDLAWFDYDSWNSFPKSLQNLFSSKIDFLYYGGVFFQYSKLREIEDELWTLLPTTHNVSVLRDDKNYKIVCIGSEDNKYSWLGEMDMRSVQNKFNSSIIISIAKDANGKIIKKVRENVGKTDSGQNSSAE